jgi:hypothetical protein
LVQNTTSDFKTAEVAHLVEHDLAKVGVAGSSPVFRSKNPLATQAEDFFYRPGGEIGRHVPISIGMDSNVRNSSTPYLGV